MNKTAIKNYAVWARNKLISDIEYKAGLLGVTDKGAAEPLPQSTGDVQFFDIGTKDYAAVQGQDVSRRGKFVDAIRDKAREGSWAEAFHQIVEKTAYTWFNRLAAIRFMEVNDYLPAHVRVLSSENENKAEPDMVTRPFDLDISFSAEEQDHILRLQDENRLDELFRWLFVRQCRKLQGILPQLFVPMDDYMELLLTVSFTDKDGVLWHLVHDIPEDDFNVEREGQVEIIGWLYQYYNTEPKDKVFADLKKNIKVSKEKIPAATQLFTPDWIVRYMVENSLGRLWVEGHPNEELKKSWKYYLEEAPQEPQVQAQLDEIRKEYAATRPEDIRVIDPCMGSGHILVYLFDVLMQIYESQGWTRRDAARSIIKNNLYGLDIDDRAAQLAYFAVMMKARQYDRRFLERDIQPHVYSTTGFSEGEEYGSLLITEDPGALPEEGQATLYDKEQIVRHLLAQKYDVVVTNPPYMGAGNMNGALAEYVKKHYPDEKSDLFACFISRGNQMVKRNGYNCMVTMQSWMFLSSFERMRIGIMASKTITNLMHMENMVMGIAFGTAVTVFWNNHVRGYKGTYNQIKLCDIEDAIPKAFPILGNRFAQVSTDNFSKIPGSPVAYWWKNFEVFELHHISEFYESAGRNKTHNNELYVRNWWEISDNARWQPYANGGVFRRWAGNDLDVVDWSDTAKSSYAEHGGLYNQKYCGKRGICWNLITSYKNGFRMKRSKDHYSSGAPTIITKSKDHDLLILAYLNSIVASSLLDILNPTLNTTTGDVLSLPVSFEKEGIISNIAVANINISQSDWDSFETSWDFQIHPMVPVYADGPDYAYRVSDFYNAWKERCQDRFDKLKANEEELNRIFIDIYGLQDELTPEVEDRDVTVRLADLGRDVRSLISYAVGCMFGRYSANGPVGLIYAGGEWDPDRYGRFQPDADNCIPITDEHYLDDDIVGRFVEFIKIVYGERTLEENLQFIANALGGKGNSSRDVIRRYFLNDFYKDHVKTYQKRPIYWLFDSGKQNGFKALVYMHRWNADTVGNLRVEYLHKMQRVYEKEIERMQDTEANSGDGHEVAQAAKRREKLVKQLKETRDYDTKLAHIALSRVDIDLDDGVKVNYEKVQQGPDGKSLGILAKI